LVAIGNMGSRKIVSEWDSSEAPTYSGRTAAKNEVEIELEIARHIAKQSFDN